jgi:hypothetical protein
MTIYIKGFVHEKRENNFDIEAQRERERERERER